ncbi:hypothetical protein [Azospirillum palustre]
MLAEVLQILADDLEKWTPSTNRGRRPLIELTRKNRVSLERLPTNTLVVGWFLNFRLLTFEQGPNGAKHVAVILAEAGGAHGFLCPATTIQGVQVPGGRRGLT